MGQKVGKENDENIKKQVDAVTNAEVVKKLQEHTNCKN